MRRFAIVILSLTTACTTAYGHEDATVMSVLRSHIRADFEVLSYDTADFDSNKQSDWVGVLKIKREVEPQIAIFVVQRKNSSVLITGKSKEVSYQDCGGRCGVEIFQTKKGAFFVNQHNHGGWGRSSCVTQFAYRNLKWLGISQKHMNLDARLDQQIVEDVNLLNSQYITSKVSGVMSGTAQPPKSKSGTRKNTQAIPLEQFDPISF